MARLGTSGQITKPPREEVEGARPQRGGHQHDEALISIHDQLTTGAKLNTHGSVSVCAMAVCRPDTRPVPFLVSHGLERNINIIEDSAFQSCPSSHFFLSLFAKPNSSQPHFQPSNRTSSGQRFLRYLTLSTPLFRFRPTYNSNPTSNVLPFHYLDSTLR